MPTLKASEPVEIQADILAEMEAMLELPSSRKYPWTPEQDAIILKGREIGLSFPKISQVLNNHCGKSPKAGGVNLRYQELTGG
jgi:hypothetical protein